MIFSPVWILFVQMEHCTSKISHACSFSAPNCLGFEFFTLQTEIPRLSSISNFDPDQKDSRQIRNDNTTLLHPDHTIFSSNTTPPRDIHA